jgi:hypothetical protein
VNGRQKRQRSTIIFAFKTAAGQNARTTDIGGLPDIPTLF